ncbi:ParB/RepB/Spo0J family partition protein [Desulforhopalus singaporensis]|uniref:Chromosome partitioning protein, ParB family n=1 Tax=Desulforhopalus singaporensis TaxID=91360 RepID=A0A1H0VXL3_9BACT|nr:ParB/RepB/Spo0J family partition protein [Desulforhopalus singaporensis]SDP83083.1 chromosome partitioning protein, ParB family [Desulforhopalus singaporensis]
MAKNIGLGQGVGLLFGKDQPEKYFECDIDRIIPNKNQPRAHFDSEDLKELAESIKEKGIIQPLIVTENNESSGSFELIAGERRLRASKLVGLSQVPVVVLDEKNEDVLLEMAIIENVQRTDLNPIEEADAYRKLIEKFGYTQEEVASRVGKKRTTVTNLLRLLKLPQNIKDDIREGLLSEGHGRALIKLVDDPVTLKELRNLIIKNGYSVRQTEKLIKKLTSAKQSPKKISQTISQEIPSSYHRALTTQLTNRLNTKVLINQNGSRGKIEIEYYSLDDLDRVTALLLVE